MPGAETNIRKSPEGTAELFSNRNNPVPFQNHLELIVKTLLCMMLRLVEDIANGDFLL